MPALGEMAPPRAGRWQAAQARTSQAAIDAPAGARGVGPRLDALRANACLSIAQLAEKIGRSHPTVRRWVQGTASPTLEDVELLAEALGCHPGDLVDWPPTVNAPGPVEAAT